MAYNTFSSSTEVGPMRHRIELHSPTQVSDGMGSYTETFAIYGTPLWSEITNYGITKEQMKNQQVSLEISHQIRIRYITGDPIKSNWKVKHGTKYYNIVSIVNRDMNNEWVYLLVKEAV